MKKEEIVNQLNECKRDVSILKNALQELSNYLNVEFKMDALDWITGVPLQKKRDEKEEG